MSERKIEDYVEIAIAFLKARSTNHLVIPKILIKDCLEQLRDAAKKHKIKIDIIEDVSLERAGLYGLAGSLAGAGVGYLLSGGFPGVLVGLVLGSATGILAAHIKVTISSLNADEIRLDFKPA
ncbi:hypothetical protein AAH150_12240 [Vibrio parahaemolyticus]|uniref:hypothetical protein n=1 Tax=Vibrio parahaemolyticus TaxID=670 RepID=UPI0032606492|nr:hypothetical protein [Vibrio parahaemolyticus]HCE1954523.1 hypothetical protein [Vibrio parahaemolyticus]HCE2180486.1 hypothetical protein [Vibrio parahaemolyticus]HCE2404485.1 hypothetical protein [Vibrio parahaemolyticus]HCE3082813.1 hypothetical protein [Vibrio parahaemolyticus]